MGKKILLIDDEELVIKSIEKILKREGYLVFIARSGEEAIEKVQTENFDLIVCDIRMPKMNGVETILHIREINKGKSRNMAKEILITGYSEDTVNQQAMDLQVADYIYKPFDVRDFLNSIKKNLEV